MKARTTVIHASHMSLLSQPEAVVAAIEEAAAATVDASVGVL